MRNQKITFITIVILLCIFLPLAILGTVFHIKAVSNDEIDTKYEFFRDGKLHFYEKNKLLGTYTCKSGDYCSLALSNVNYLEGVIEHKEDKNQKLPLVNNRYAFLMDTETSLLKEADIILYDVQIGKELARYKEVKNYGIGIDNGLFIVKNKEGMYGVIELSDIVKVKLPFEYNYIALRDNVNSATNKIVSDIFSVKKGDSWYLIDENNNKISDYFNETIVSYNDKSLIVSNGSTVRLLGFFKDQVLMEEYKYLNYCDKYIVIVNLDGLLYLYDSVTNIEVGGRHKIDNIADLECKMENGHVNVYANKELAQSIAIS